MACLRPNPKPHSPRPAKPSISNAAVFAAVSLLSLLAAEILIRFALPVPARGYGVWAGYPGSELTMKSAPDRFSAVLRYNRFGFRGADFPVERRTRHRIACVGDSYTEGLGAEEDESWPARLGARLADRGAEVLNLGDARLPAVAPRILTRSGRLPAVVPGILTRSGRLPAVAPGILTRSVRRPAVAPGILTRSVRRSTVAPEVLTTFRRHPPVDSGIPITFDRRHTWLLRVSPCLTAVTRGLMHLHHGQPRSVVTL